MKHQVLVGSIIGNTIIGNRSIGDALRVAIRDGCHGPIILLSDETNR